VREETETIDQRRLMVPALAGLYGNVSSYAYALLRVVTGLMLLPGGIDKMFYGGAGRIAAGNITQLGGIFKPAIAWGWAVAAIEFFGAILLVVGLFTRPVAFSMVVMLAVIAFGIMALRGAFWTTGGIEVALLLALAAFGFVIGGGGRYSLDRVIGKEF
jgi:putative oxidoreductase